MQKVWGKEGCGVAFYRARARMTVFFVVYGWVCEERERESERERER